LLPRFGTILYHWPHLIEQTEPLIDVLLRIGGIRTLLRCRCLAADASVACVIRTKSLTIAALRIPSRSACYAVSDIARPASRIASLTRLPVSTVHAALTLTTLTTLPTLSLLALALALTLALTLTLATTLTLLAGLSVHCLLLASRS